jgi:hypothetical protein
MAEIVQEYPKMLYLHPVDKTKEHKFITVNSCDDESDALKAGYKLEPHVPVPAPEDQFDEVEYERAGSGTERWSDAGDWTQSKGEGLTDDTSAVEKSNEQGTDLKPEDVPEALKEQEEAGFEQGRAGRGTEIENENG